MANTNSDQITALASSSGKVAANELSGRVRVAYFSVGVVPTGAGDTMTLTKLPKGAKVIGGQMIFSAAQTGTTAIGITGTTGKYHAATVISNVLAFTGMIAGLTVDNVGTDTTAEETILATNASAVWVTGTFKGYILYVVD